jgi:Pyruvate/2-oxoacid:ferredoxin oxidoreductase delta subunit
MLPYLEVTSTCIACDNCRLICPEKSITNSENNYLIDTWSCTLCHICVEVCPVDSIKLRDPDQKK